MAAKTTEDVWAAAKKEAETFFALPAVKTCHDRSRAHLARAAEGKLRERDEISHLESVLRDIIAMKFEGGTRDSLFIDQTEHALLFDLVRERLKTLGVTAA